MNIFLRELKANRKALIIWCACMFALVGIGMLKYAGFSQSGEAVNELMNSMPNAVKAMFGIGLVNLTEVRGYYSIFFLYFILIGTVHASMLGANIISKEEKDKTAEFLMAKPATRNKIVTSKLAAAVVNILILNVTTLISSIIFVGHYSNGETINNVILKLMLAMFILQLIYMAIGTAIAAISKNSKISTSIATVILMFTFILSMAIDMNNKLEKLKYITPFKYFDGKNLVFGNGFDEIFLILSSIIFVVLILVTYSFYSKRDLNI